MELVNDAAKVTAQDILGARKFPNSKDGRMIGSHTPETVLVGAQRIGSHVGVAAVIFSAGHGVAIAKTIELFRINREHSAIMLMNPEGHVIGEQIIEHSGQAIGDFLRVVDELTTGSHTEWP